MVTKKQTTTKQTRTKRSGNLNKGESSKIFNQIVKQQIEQTKQSVNNVKLSYSRGVVEGLATGVIGMTLIAIVEIALEIIPTTHWSAAFQIGWMLARLGVALALGSLIANFLTRRRNRFEKKVDEIAGKAIKDMREMMEEEEKE